LRWRRDQARNSPSDSASTARREGFRRSVDPHQERQSDRPERDRDRTAVATRRELQAVAAGPGGISAAGSMVARKRRIQKDLHGWAKRAGLLEVHSERLVAGYKRIAHLSNQEIERRLEEAPQDVSIKDLAVVAGIASDKIARYERWGAGEKEDNGVDRFGELMAVALLVEVISEGSSRWRR